MEFPLSHEEIAAVLPASLRPPGAPEDWIAAINAYISRLNDAMARTQFTAECHLLTVFKIR